MITETRLLLLAAVAAALCVALWTAARAVFFLFLAWHPVSGGCACGDSHQRGAFRVGIRRSAPARSNKASAVAMLQRVLTLLLASATVLAAVNTHGTTAFVIPGADPTGRNDSSAALNAYVKAQCAAQTAAVAGGGLGLGLGSLALVPRDADVDLGGGVYRMDAPLAINSSMTCTGMLRVHDGTLVAGSGLGGFAATNESFLVTVLDYWNGLGVSLDRMVFASNFTGGGVRVDAAHHVHVVDSNFVNFETHAVWGSAHLGMGHELAVDRCRMTECTLGMAPCADVRGKHATAIMQEFPDSHFRNTVITCSRQGVVNRGGANLYSGMHIWTSCNPHATGDNLTVGFLDEVGSSQITDMYMDNCRMVIQGGGRGTMLTNSYFNGAATLELRPPAKPPQPIDPTDPQCQYWRGAVCGHVITGNRFGCTGTRCATISVPGWTPAQAAGVQVALNTFEGRNSSVCALKSHCASEADCATLFGLCP